LVGTSNTIVLGRTTDTTVIGATGTATNGILQNKILQVTGDVGITGNVSIGGTFTASGFVGNGSGLTNLNAGNISTGIVSVARGGTGVDGSAAANGALLIGNGSGFALGMLNGTANQISVTNDPGSITLALPQDISPTSTPTFGGMVLHGPLAAQEATISGNLRTGRLFFTNSASNVVIGQNSLNNPESGYYNIAIGDYVMPGNISGFNNIGIGNGAQNCNETGHSNIALGYETLNCLQSGDLNTAVGTSALYSTDGLGNTGIGARAMSSNHTGNENTALGFYAGSQRGNDYAARQRYGSNNTYLGAYAHPTVDNLSYATVIGSDASVSTSNTVVLGRASDVVVLGATGDDGSGNRLQVNGNARFTGNVDFNSLSVSGVPATLAFRYASDTGSEFYAEPNLGLGQGALASRKSAGNVALGDGVLGQMNTLGWGDESGSWNTGVGYQALYKNDYGDENSALGYKTLYENTSGYYNVAVGGWSLYSNTSGYLNTAIGYQALYANTTARRNVAVGGYALSANTEGSDNTAVGYNAMGYTGITSFNTAVGRAAMSYLSTGNSNTAIGRRSGDFLDTGSNNTFIGEYAGFGASTSNNNIAIGRYSQIADNLDRATVIGTDAYVATSNTMVLGGSTQVVVIGSSSDDGSGNKLQVSGGIRASGNAIFNTGNPGHYTQLRDLRIMSSGDDAQWDHLRVRTDGVSSVIDAGGAENGLIFRVGQGASGGIGDQSYNTVLSLFPDQSAVFSGRIQVADRLSFSSINGNRILLWGDNHGFGINTSNLSAFVPAGGNYFSIREGSYNGPEHFSVNPSGNWIRLGGTATDQMIYIGRNDPGGGGGDQAYMRYYVRSGEATTFALGNPNDGDDHIALLPGGNVGIGTAEPQYKLDVVGD
ncbi:MAG TPA: hypothetical protein VFV43_06380, partial [Limnobacter sp.]|nr:hypothetical protein [Limnobacter sp.]